MKQIARNFVEKRYDLLPPETQTKEEYAPIALANATAAYNAASFAHLPHDPLHPVSSSTYPQVFLLFTEHI